MSLGYWETLASINADGTALTAAARASLLQGPGGKQGLYTMAANKFRVNDVIHLRASGRISCVVTTPGTARFSLGIGAVDFMDTLAIPLNIVAKVSVPWILDMVGTVRSIGNAGTMFWQGFWLSEAALNVALPATGPGPGGNTLPYNTAPVVGTAVDMTTAGTIDFNWTQTVATGSITLHQYMLALLTSTGF